jgi:pimeloyl-ACP methyl ester carboxylesterase
VSAPESRFAEVNGVQLHYVEEGTGKLVLFLHGFPEAWFMWRRVLPIVGAQYRAVACDTRGVNLSGGPDDVAGYRIEALVADVAALIAHLGHERAVLVAHDWGGLIAWWTAILRPEIVERLVIVNCAHPGVFRDVYRDSAAQREASAYMAVFASPQGESLISRDGYAGFEAAIVRPALAAGHLTPAEAEDWRTLWRRRDSMTHALNYYRALPLAPKPPDEAMVVRVPTLVIWGDRDIYMLPENVDRLGAVVPDLTVRRFPENDHWIVTQRPEDVARLVVEFAGGSPA